MVNMVIAALRLLLPRNHFMKQLFIGAARAEKIAARTIAMKKYRIMARNIAEMNRTTRRRII
jgi:hypothetical protein